MKSTMMSIEESARLLAENLDTIVVAKRAIVKGKQIISVNFEGFDDQIFIHEQTPSGYEIESLGQLFECEDYSIHFQKLDNLIINHFIVYIKNVRKQKQRTVDEGNFRELIGLPFDALKRSVTKKLV